MKSHARILGGAVFGLTLALAAPGAFAGSHTWDVWEVFSNADGTIQFVEIHEANGTDGEIGLGGHVMRALPSGHNFTITNSVAPPTGNKFYLFATAGYAALAGAPPPDQIMANNFLAIATDTQVSYEPWDTGTWAAGAIPTDGIHSLSRTGVGSPLVSSINSPTNYAGNTGSIDVSGGGGGGPLSGVPDGSNGSAVLLSKLAADGSSIQITYDTTSCTGTLDHQIVYGQRNGLPTAPGGIYTPLGGTCNIGNASPFTWNPTPTPTDGSGLIWFLVVTENNAGKEGSWGKYDAASERKGPGTNGASNVCGVTDRDLTNVCGH